MKRMSLVLILLILALAVAGCSLKAATKNDGTEAESTEGTKTEEQAAEKPKEPDPVTEESSVVEYAITLNPVNFLEEYERKSVKLPFAPSDEKASVAPYEVATDLSNVVNLEHFGSFTDAQKESLVKNGFVVCTKETANGELGYDQIFHIYDRNSYLWVPSFVTGDSMTHLFHIFYDSLLRSTERDQIYPKLKSMTEALLASNIETYEAITDARVKELQLRNVAFFGVAANLLGSDTSALPKEAVPLVAKEMESVENKMSGQSIVTGGDVDFSQMTVRGHYTRDETLEKYFLATMYYGQVGFYLYDGVSLNEDSIGQAMLMTHSAYKDEAIFRAWSEAIDPIDFLVESAEDLSIREVSKVFYAVYGQEPDLNLLFDEAKFQTAAKMLGEHPDPVIDPGKGKSFRFIPQRAVMDNVLMQNVVDLAEPGKPSDRPIYSGLDLMATFGSKKAKEIQYEDPYNAFWSEYKAKLDENIGIVEFFKEEDWQKNLYRGWLWMLSEYVREYGEGYPMFMQNEAWQRKDLASALGSWAELKHDTVLYGKQVGAQKGGGLEQEYPRGYVEPNLALFEKLSWLLEYTKLNLADRNMLGDNEIKIDQFKEMVDRCIAIIKKELNNENLTEEEVRFLFQIGGAMEQISTRFVESDGMISYWWEIESETDRRMPIVADLMITARNNCNIPEGQYLHTASGAPNEIYVIYPYDGKLYLGRGGVFSYYEFLDTERLTDEIWQERVINTKPELPKWEADLIHDGKGEVTGNKPQY